jgi:hypothetical protein
MSFIPILNTAIYLPRFSVIQKVTFHCHVREWAINLRRAQRKVADVENLNIH